MKKQILLSAALIFGSISFAQNLSASELFEEEGIYLKGLKQYSKNGRIEKIGRYGKNIEEEMKDSEEALETFAEYKKNRKLGDACGVVGGVSGVGVIVGFLGNKPILAIVSAGVYLGSTAVNMVFTTKAQSKLEDAVHIRNRDLLKEVK